MRRLCLLATLLGCLVGCGSVGTTSTLPTPSAINQIVIGKIYHADGIDFSIQRYEPFIDVRHEPDVSEWYGNHIFRLICTLHNTTSQSWRALPVIWGGAAFLPPIKADATPIDGGGVDSTILNLSPQGTITRRLYYEENSPVAEVLNLSINKTLVNGNGHYPDPPSPPIALITIQAWILNGDQMYPT